VDDLVGAIRSVLDGTATRTAVGSAGRYGGSPTIPSIPIGDDPGSTEPGPADDAEPALVPARAGTSPATNGGAR
jgi:hypothetical protein